jgi:DNA end-binding protein Ku
MLAKHIVNQKTADFDPEKFEDHYEEALTELRRVQTSIVVGCVMRRRPGM